MRKAGRREHWSKLIAEQQASGQTVRAFCQERGIGKYAFYRWRSLLAECEQPMRFALLETKQPVRDPEAAIELTLTGGERLRIPNGVDTATLRMVIEAVRA